MNSQKRCWGITRNLIRCQRSGDWKFFCHEHKRQPIVWLFVCIFTVLGLNFATLRGYFRNSEKPQPKLSLVPLVMRNEADLFGIPITNESSHMKLNVETSSTNSEFLLLPMRDEDANAILRFGVRNGSAIDVESVEVTFTVPKRWNCAPEYGWIPALTGDRSFVVNPDGKRETVELQTWIWIDQYLTHPSGITACPKVTVNAPPRDLGGEPIGLRVRAKGMANDEVKSVALQVSFVRTNRLFAPKSWANITNPIIVRGVFRTNTNGGHSFLPDIDMRSDIPPEIRFRMMFPPQH